MSMISRILYFIGGVVFSVSSASAASSEVFQDDYKAFLYQGQTVAATKLAAQALGQAGEDQEARFALGVSQFLLAVENLGHGLYSYGLKSEYHSELSGNVLDLPFLRLPVPQNEAPEQVSYEALRGLLDQFVTDLAVANNTLSGVTDQDFDFPLDLARIRLDFDGDGHGSEREALLYSLIAVAGRVNSDNGYLVDFDQSDAPWLSGYCHLLSAMAEFPLAHEWEFAFNTTFHGLFPKSDLPSSQINLEFATVRDAMQAIIEKNGSIPRYTRKPYSMSWEEWAESDPNKTYRQYKAMRDIAEFGAIADLVAFFHLFNWPVVEPERMASAREHLLGMIATSRENWMRIQAETDNQREWVPAPGQSGIFQRMRVDQDTVVAWHLFLDDFEAVLQGERLIKHWRFIGKGINIRRMFEEPRTFDPWLIGQGSAVLPYLEEGDLVTGDTAMTMLDLFDGGFFAYFIWFN